MALDTEVNQLYTKTKYADEMEKMKRAYHEEIISLKRKLKASQQKARRYKKRNAPLKDIVKQLKKTD